MNPEGHTRCALCGVLLFQNALQAQAARAQLGDCVDSKYSWLCENCYAKILAWNPEAHGQRCYLP